MIDHPLTRAQETCPLCGGHKNIGLVACWPCFRSSGLKNDDEKAKAKLDTFESVMKQQSNVAAQLFEFVMFGTPMKF
jgi:hypothetical protein